MKNWGIKVKTGFENLRVYCLAEEIAAIGEKTSSR